MKNTIKNYRDGRCTIREAAEIAGLRYFEFFEILAKENLIGTNPDNFEFMLNYFKKKKN